MNQIWWGRVPNAMAFVQDITENLLGEKSVLLQAEQSIPWHETMIEKIKESVMQQNSSKRFEVIYHESDPGPYLLNEFCKAEKRAAYRPTKSFARFLAESDDEYSGVWVPAIRDKIPANRSMIPMCFQ